MVFVLVLLEIIHRLPSLRFQLKRINDHDVVKFLASLYEQLRRLESQKHKHQ
jgi:hypothetical protein